MTITNFFKFFAYGISTHTPLARCDEKLLAFAVLFGISTHTPLARCDFCPICRHYYSTISTHTPLARCGPPCYTFSGGNGNFNSHTPREVWQCSGLVLCKFGNFNSHTPREVWPFSGHCAFSPLIFQLTHPSRGVALQAGRTTTHKEISTHTPLARCGNVYNEGFDYYVISTHTPLARCGGMNSPSSVQPYLFQLTHPSRGVARSVQDVVNIP